MNTYIIVIPVYNDTPTELEQLSLRQLDNIIKDDAEICFVGPNKINFFPYIKLFNNSKPTFTNFDDKYFESNKSYSQLCLSYNFYKAFEDYEYMLIYQTDCWIFRNEINKFCEMGYDYIGGPIYSPGSHWPSFKRGMRPVVGNGGLSLRKISKMLYVTDKEGYIYNKYKERWDTIEYEDMFICDEIAHDIYMSIPDYKIAEQFSIDALPLHINKLHPMAAHRVFALYQYWNKHIDELNDKHIVELCTAEYENFKKMYS